MDPPGLYVHTPFCKTKCPYCDFYSITNTSAIDLWLEAIGKEAAMYKGEFGAFDSLYLGGGTPSLLDNLQMEKLIKTIRQYFIITQDAEVTIEINPDDITAEKLQCWRACGINRISVGVQSFNDDELIFLKRRHSVYAAEMALNLLRSSDFENFGIDLMYGLPGQTEGTWQKTLENALSFEPKHLSCYQLTLEERTPYWRLKAEGKLNPVGEDKERRFFVLTSDYLKSKDFIHYEVSNFAKTVQYESRHNKKYWQHAQYLGLGPAAHSFKDNMRWWNHRSVELYCKSLFCGNDPIQEKEVLKPEQLKLERLFLGFRTKFGVSMDDVKDSPSFEQTLSRLKRKRIVTVYGDRIMPTLKGFLIADKLPQMFF